jgi:hypothetical protein
MSTVLWANYRQNGQVVAEQADYRGLYEHTEKLDEFCRKLELPAFSGLQDTTDAQCNAGLLELPAGMASSDELMARDGVWIDAETAVELMDTLKVYLIEHYPHIGLVHNATPDLINELEQVLDFAMQAESLGADFNFSVVQ